MPNEITAFLVTKKPAKPIIAWAAGEVYQVDETGTYQQLWEISKPVANVVNLDETAFAQAYGDFSGNVEVDYTVTIASPTTYSWAGSDGSSGAGLLTDMTIAISNSVFFRFNQVVDAKQVPVFVGGESWTFSVFLSAYAVSGIYNRWAVAPYLNGAFFCNPDNKVKYLNGSTVNNFGWATTDQPSGKYLAMWMGRIIIGQPTYKGVLLNNGVMWSDVNNFMNFDTKMFINEADQYVFDTCFNISEAVDGCTGIGALGPDKLLVYTPGQIYMLTYVGLPLVMQRMTLSSKVGNVFPYALIVSQSVHGFIGQDNFYIVDGGGAPRQIGDRVWAAFTQDLTENPSLRYNLFGYIDVNRRELWWVYCSKSSTGDFDRKVGYNYVSDTWQFADANEHSFVNARIPTGITVIANDNRIIDTVTQSIISTGQASGSIELRLYGQDERKVSVESDQPDQAVGPVYLETADIIYDPAKMVAIDGMDIHADYDGATCNGVLVEWSSRNNISEPIVWIAAPLLWTKNLAGTRWGYPRTRGRIFRYRFTFIKNPSVVAITYAQFYFWNEFVQGLRNNADDK